MDVVKEVKTAQSGKKFVLTLAIACLCLGGIAGAKLLEVKNGVAMRRANDTGREHTVIQLAFRFTDRTRASVALEELAAAGLSAKMDDGVGGSSWIVSVYVRGIDSEPERLAQEFAVRSGGEDLGHGGYAVIK